ncbi:putative NBD/HSP70 family sugar kinase [Curtobacterium sp. PhB130]|uniref:ROK family protein n=1 Tax=unclassified Curtobacterium TaxID=257496 RepID=UPI000F4CE3CB|nr:MULTISPECIES: ROK family protein [unclassified Curtobacterium]ROS75984.1 putative NBD/HSP70 family sugar kinase [Curtobacterium sp. PhB130]
MPQRRGTARGSSAEIVLDHAFAARAFTATEAMDATGLTRSTVLAACDELVRLGWIRELDDARAAGEYRMGRPARRYGLDERAGVVVGIDAGQHRIAVLVADLRGTVLGRASGDLGEAGLDVPVRLGVIRDTVARALAAAAVPGDDVLVTTVGVPAPVDAVGASPADDGGYWAAMNPGFGAVLRQGTVVVENDANLAAVAERGAGGDGSFAALLAGERFGTGLVVDGTLLRGAHGGAGEMRVLDLVAGVGSPEGLGSTARVLAAEAVADGRVLPGTPLAAAPDGIDAAALFAAAEAGDAVAVELVERLGDRLARVCVVLASLLDIDRVVVAGAIAEPAEVVIAHARRLLDTWHYDPVPTIVASTLGADVVVRGAIALALDVVREAPLALSLPGRTAIVA